MVTKYLGPVSLTPNTEVSKKVTFSRSGSFWYTMLRLGLLSLASPCGAHCGGGGVELQ